MQEEHDKQLKAEELKHEAMVTKLEAEKFELAEGLREATEKLNVETDKWKKEQSKALSLMFSKSVKIDCVSKCVGFIWYMHIAA